MIRNGKYFVPPEGGDDDFKALFKRLAAAGAGRPADEDGLPPGPWTPDLLADAITRIEANRAGIDLRTVQLWFGDNEKGISADNIRWLARVFGCGDPEATSAWQVELSASQARLVANRRAKRSGEERVNEVPAGDDAAPGLGARIPLPRPGTRVQEGPVREGLPTPSGRPSLARWSETLFDRGSSLDLPALIFAGAVALQFVAYFLGLHSITYTRADGIAKQVGFHWATNWTFLFLVFLPLFTIFAGDLLLFWKRQGRAALLRSVGLVERTDGWLRKVERSSATFWAVLVICLGFAGVLQWISLRLIPLTRGVDSDDIDWGSVALMRPDAISVPEAVAFTGLAYLYMCLCFYLMFAGLILLYTLAHDYWEITSAGGRRHGEDPEAGDLGLKVMHGIVRCTAAGLLVAICMNVQHRFLSSDAETVWGWLFRDAASVLPVSASPAGWSGYGFAMHFTSLLVALPSCIVLVYAIVRVGIPGQLHASWTRMAAAQSVVGGAYLLIGAFAGFSIMLGAAILLAIYGFFDPGFGGRANGAAEESRRVS